HFWHAHQGQIYPTLDRMERAGWIRSRKVVQRGRPNKRVFTITALGERVMLTWLRSPYEHARFKHAPLLRTRFLGHLSADEAREALEVQRKAWTRYLATLRDIEATYFDGKRGAGRRANTDTRFENVNAMFSYFTLRYGITWTETSIAWCNSCIELLEGHRALFPARAGSSGRRGSAARQLAAT
ncbi:MAG TPA: PadR family transcriptional regulator, partial [Candidatus Binataceae bacterium]|nr:PadR family transcriptional regulator [Candidatus Binataceae bacterium]